MGFFGNNMYGKKDRQKFSKEGKILFIIFLITTIVFTFIFLSLRLKGYVF